jgi:hypothetical protein
MKYLSLCLLLFQLTDLPYKPKEEFEIKLDYKFKQRPSSDRTVVHMDETVGEKEKRISTDMLPYLILNVKVLKLNEEVKMKISNNLGQRVFSKKVEEGTIVPLDVGFTADIKDRVSPHEYILTFVNAEKNATSRIVIFVDKDGSFLVNGEKRGRF